MDIATGVYQVTGWSTVTVFETGDGLVQFDTGLASESEGMAEALREVTDAPVHTVIYTHGHMDHVYGLEHFLLDGRDQPEIVAHERMADRFDRYEKTAGHNEAIDARQFGGTADVFGSEQGSISGNSFAAAAEYAASGRPYREAGSNP